MLSQGLHSSRRLALISLRRSSNRTKISEDPLGQTVVTTGTRIEPTKRAPFAKDPTVRISAVAVLSLSVGFVLGRFTVYRDEDNRVYRKPVLPSGEPRACCDGAKLTQAQQDLPDTLAAIVGANNVLDGRHDTTSTLPFLKGARLGGGGQALAIITPRSLRDTYECVKAIVGADCVILPQGANTGLTGGSVPRVECDRPAVIVSMKHVDAIFPIDDGKRVVCMGGAGLATLSNAIPTWFPDRESHSILGSTFLNPTTAAGVALGSGGTQLRKGPAYTDRALYLRVHKTKFGETTVEVVNTLGIEGLEDAEFVKGAVDALKAVDNYQQDIKSGIQRKMGKSSNTVNGNAKASDADYATRVCQHDDQVSRCNADCRGADCNRSEGKVLILATVHDTFPKPQATKSFWLSFPDLDTALAFRKEVCLDNPNDLPISVEYMNRDCFDIVDRSGRILASVIKLVGSTGSLVKYCWGIKLWIEFLPIPGANLWVDKLMYALNPIVPATLPDRIMKAGKEHDHHIAMTVGEYGNGTMDRLLERMKAFAVKHGEGKIVINECNTASEANSLTAFRFVAAPAFRTWCVGEGVQGFSVDYALPKNGGVAPHLSSAPLKRMRYSHFGCNVVHEDLAFGLDVDTHQVKMELKKTIELECGGKLPAEHGHGTEYDAPTETQERWKKIDPLNMMNPGVGGLSYKYKYQAG
jgi:D-lactate dehydrogenase (quinone)